MQVIRIQANPAPVSGPVAIIKRCNPAPISGPARIVKVLN